MNIIFKKLSKDVKRGGGMDKKCGFSANDNAFSDVIPDMEEALYCDPLERENESGEKPFSPKNKEKRKNNEKIKEKGTFF